MGDFLTRKVDEIGKKCINEDGIFMADEFTRLLDEELSPKELLRCIEIDETPKSSVFPHNTKADNNDSRIEMPPLLFSDDTIQAMVAAATQEKAHQNI